MPLDINLFRIDRGGDPDKIRESQRRRFASVELVDDIIEKDNLWRQVTGDIDNLKKERNAIQKQVGIKKKAKEECEDMVQQIQQITNTIEQKEAEKENLKVLIDSMVGKVGNLVDLTVPVSKDEDKDNAVVSTWGNPRDPAGLLNHHDLLWRIGGYEPERGVGVAGHRAYFLRDVGVLLNQAFINYGISFLRQRQYCCLQPPYFMKKSVMSGVAQLEQFDEELYKVSGDGEDKYLIATSEQPICGYHMGEWLEEKSLPLRYCGISTCFRKEAGSHGKDTWGIFRVHQFEKVEQFVICEGDLEKSQKLQEEMSHAAEEFYQSLGFPYRVINIVTGALNNAAIRKFDLECWFPGYNAYRELVSCSNCTDYQSRAMEIRSGIKKLGETEKKYVHMLNATLCATGRAICCLLETYQEPNGVRIPDVLVPFMGGITFLPFVRDSKNAPSIPQSVSTKKPKDEKKSSEETTSTADTPESALVAAITAKGDEIRTLKAAKADKATVTAKVEELNALKNEYQTLTGKPYAPPGSTAKSTPAATPAPTASAAPALPQASAPTGPEAELLQSITTVGEEVRTLKAAKADKDTIKAKVDELLALKTRYQELTGHAPGQTAAAAPTDSKPKSDKKEAKNAKSESKAAPAKKEEKATPAPAAKPAVVSAPKPPASVWVNGKLDLPSLEAKLKVFSYVAGYEPTAEDNRVLAAIEALGNTNFTTNPQTTRWLRNITSFSAEERATWN